MSAVALQLSAFYREEEKVSPLALTYSQFNALSQPLNTICRVQGISFYFYSSQEADWLRRSI